MHLLREWGRSEDRGERGIVLSFSFLELFRNRNIFFHLFFSDAVKVDGISSLTISPVLLNARDELGMVTGVVLFATATREHMLWVSRLAEVLMAALALLKTPSRSYLDPIV